MFISKLTSNIVSQLPEPRAAKGLLTNNGLVKTAKKGIVKGYQKVDLRDFHKAKEFLEQNYYDSRQIFSIIRDCAYKSNKLLNQMIE